MELKYHNFGKVLDLFAIDGRTRIQLQSYLEFFFVLHNVRPAAIVFIADKYLKELREMVHRLDIFIIPYNKNPEMHYGSYVIVKSKTHILSNLARKAIDISRMTMEEKHLVTGELLGYMTPLNIASNRSEDDFAAELEVSLIYNGDSYNIQTIPQVVRGKTPEMIEAYYAPMIECLKLLNQFSLIHFEDALIKIKPMSEVKAMVKRGGNPLLRQKTFEPSAQGQQMPPAGTFGSMASSISNAASNNNNRMNFNNNNTSSVYSEAEEIPLTEFNRPMTPERPPVPYGYKTPNRPTQSIFGKPGQLPREVPPTPRKYRSRRSTRRRRNSRKSSRRHRRAGRH